MPAADPLTAPDLARTLELLGLRPDDVTDVVTLARRVAADPDRRAVVDRYADGLRAGLDHFPGEPDRPDPWPGYDPETDPDGVGALPLLALVLTAGDLAAFHRRRGIPAEVSAQTLTELGQQLAVHRLTFGELGLHTYGWLTWTWSGSLYWLGRLQFNLERRDDGWVCSTHIPRSGPLDPDAVDASFARAAALFPRHFPERAAQDFWCWSWLLDPDLLDGLDPASNMARFGRRWRRYGEPVPADDDALFFAFARRGTPDLDALPQRTSLERLLVARWRAGGHWRSATGTIPMATHR